MMQKKVAAEGEKDKDMHEKFMCWCKTAGSDLEKKHRRQHCQNSRLPIEDRRTGGPPFTTQGRYCGAREG